jgi:hypothetical protein
LHKEAIMDISSTIRFTARLLKRLVPLAAALAVSACGGSGGAAVGSNQGMGACDPANPAAQDECGSVVLAVTDADGDFVSYVVDVLSVTLHRAGGGVVETLPATTRIDFAELTELSELLSVTTVAPGDIVGGTIRLDYGNAEINVESGGNIVPAEVVDGNGAPLGVVELEIRLAERNHLVITRGRTALLSIDFDLSASHEVDLSATPALVTAEPYLVAEVRPLTEKEIRVRGTLVDVDAAGSSYDIRVRPWHRRDGDFGIVTVHTTSTTTFEIDGVPYTGAPGLVALDALAGGTLTIAFGTLDLQDRSFTAEIVDAGDSIGGERFAAIHGNVVARNGDTLTVKGAIAVHRDRPARFRRTVVVELGPSTGVSKAGDPQAVLDKDDISVGQRIVAFGEFTNPDTEDSDPATPGPALILDATEGRVRMLATRLHGTVAGILPGQLNMRLRAIDRLGVELFDFTGTGITASTDADPLDYEIGTGTLSLAALEVDKRAAVVGFVAPFGEAPPDFFGRTVIDHRDIPVALGIGWGLEGTNAPFSSMGPSGLVVDLANPDIGVRHHLKLGRHVVDLFDLPGTPSIVPDGTRSLYGLWEPGHVELFVDFAEFVDELAIRIGGGDAARALAAYGAYDESTNTVTANRIVVHLLPAE